MSRNNQRGYEVQVSFQISTAILTDIAHEVFESQ